DQTDELVGRQGDVDFGEHVESGNAVHRGDVEGGLTGGVVALGAEVADAIQPAVAELEIARGGKGIRERQAGGVERKDPCIETGGGGALGEAQADRTRSADGRVVGERLQRAIDKELLRRAGDLEKKRFGAVSGDVLTGDLRPDAGNVTPNDRLTGGGAGADQ